MTVTVLPVVDIAEHRSSEAYTAPLQLRRQVWRYDVLGPTSVLWTSPHRRRYLVDDTGSRDVTDTESVRRHDQDLGPPGDGCRYTLAG